MYIFVANALACGIVTSCSYITHIFAKNYIVFFNVFLINQNQNATKAVNILSFILIKIPL